MTYQVIKGNVRYIERVIAGCDDDLKLLIISNVQKTLAHNEDIVFAAALAIAKRRIIRRQVTK